MTVFGIGMTELLVVGLICTFLALPIIIAVVVVALATGKREDP